MASSEVTFPWIRLPMYSWDLKDEAKFCKVTDIQIITTAVILALNDENRALVIFLAYLNIFKGNLIDRPSFINYCPFDQL